MVYNYVSIQLKQNIAQQNMVTNTIDDWITATYNRQKILEPLINMKRCIGSTLSYSNTFWFAKDHEGFSQLWEKTET